MNRPPDEIIDILTKIRQKAEENKAYREAMLANPKTRLREEGLPIGGDAKFVVEYHEGYGLFVAIPIAQAPDHRVSRAENSTHKTLQDHPADDCLHY